MRSDVPSDSCSKGVGGGYKDVANDEYSDDPLSQETPNVSTARSRNISRHAVAHTRNTREKISVDARTSLATHDTKSS